jgi:hypothetical protein
LSEKAKSYREFFNKYFVSGIESDVYGDGDAIVTGCRPVYLTYFSAFVELTSIFEEK